MENYNFKEYKKRKNITPKKQVKEAKTPSWFNQNIEEDTATKEEIEKLESRMKRG